MRALLYAVIVAGAVVIQVTILDGLPLPGGAAPDLVLLAVVALALTGGAIPGMVTGFAAGLVFDIAPPQGHVIGQSALVLCLLGYLCGLASRELERSVFLPLAAMALGAAAGAVLYVAVGKIFADPAYSWAAVGHVLPATVGYDVLASPFVLYAVSRLVRLAGQVPVPGSLPAPVMPGRAAAGAGLLSAVAPARAAAEPRIRHGGRSADGWIGMGRSAGAQASGAGPAVRQLSGGSSVNTGGTALPGSPARLRLRPAKAARPQPKVATGRRDYSLRLGGGATSMPKAARKTPAQPRFRGHSVGGSALDSDRRLGRGRPRREPKFRGGGLLGGNVFGGGPLGGGIGGGSLGGGLGSGGLGGGLGGRRMSGRSPAQPKFRGSRLGGGLGRGGLGPAGGLRGSSGVGGRGGLGGRGAGARLRLRPGRAGGGALARAVRSASGRLDRRSGAGRPLTGRSSVFRIGSRGTGGLR